jgi:hypothetical protein
MEGSLGTKLVITRVVPRLTVIVATECEALDVVVFSPSVGAEMVDGTVELDRTPELCPI